MKIRLLFFCKLLGFGCLATLGFFGLERFCQAQTDGFARYRIVSNLTPFPDWELPAPSPQEKQQLDRLLCQPFYYLGKGAQAYVFASQDGTAVIKFCRFEHLRPSLWFSLPFFPCYCYEKERLERLLQSRKRLEQEFASYTIAFSKLKEETGLIYLHLNTSSHLNTILTIHDKGKVVHHLDLDRMQFIIQKRAVPFYSGLSQLIQNQGEHAAKHALDQLVRFLSSRLNKGISDTDAKLVTNFGFLETSPIQIDIGRFGYQTTPLTQEETKQEIHKIIKPLRAWLDLHSPALSSYLEERTL